MFHEDRNYSKAIYIKKVIVLAVIVSLSFFAVACNLMEPETNRYVPARSTLYDNKTDTGDTGDTGASYRPVLDIEPDINPGIGSGHEFSPPELPDTAESTGLERDEFGILIGSLVFDEPVLLMGAYDVINVRDGPDIATQRVATIGMGQVAEATEVVDGWYHITIFPGMFTGYARSDLLVDYDENIKYFAAPRVDYIVRPGSNGEDIVMESTLVDVRTIIPDIEYHMIFATPDNFTGSTLYARDVPILQSGTADKLAKAFELFVEDGYRIKIYDAYRPSSVSGILFSIIGDPTYIAPQGTSMHNRAAAIDMTLVDFDGNELEMPSPMHTLDRTSNRDYQGMSAEARKNMDYMASVMRKCGFTTVQSEWWHFSDSEIANYPPLDFTFMEFFFYPVQA